jgi:dihydrofolate reductase
MRSFSLIVSCSENRVIGRGGRLPWTIPEDKSFFLDKTKGRIVILGRLCYQAWPQVDLDGRRPIVVTSRPELLRNPARGTTSLTEALELASEWQGEIFICGGERIYAEAIALPQAERLYLTLVHADIPGDRFFPDWTPFFKRAIQRRDSSESAWSYTFLTLER